MSRRLPDPISCPSFHPGHGVHWIQARLSYKEGPRATIRVDLDEASGAVRFSFRGEEHVHYVHDPQRLAAALAGSHRLAEWRPAVHVLAVRHGSSATLFNLAKKDEWRPCRGSGIHEEEVNGGEHA